MKYLSSAYYTQSISEAYGPEYSLTRAGKQYFFQFTIYKISLSFAFTIWNPLS